MCWRATRKGPSRLAVAFALPLAPASPGHALTGPSTARHSSSSGRHLVCPDALEFALLVENRPGDAGKLVGERDRQHIVVQTFFGSLDPGLEPIAVPMLWPDPDQYDPGCLHEQRAQIAIAAPGYLAEDGTVCFGTSPSQAPKSRPLENAAPLPIAATVALEMIGPMPGTVISRSHAGSPQASAPISLDRTLMRSSSRCQSSASPSMRCSMRGDRTSVRLASMLGNSMRRPRLSRPMTWKEFLPISMPATAIAVLSFEDIACSLSLAPLASVTCWRGRSTAGPFHYRVISGAE